MAGSLHSKMTIKRVLFGALGALSLLGAATLGWQANQDWAGYQRAADSREFDRGANQFRPTAR